MKNRTYIFQKNLFGKAILIQTAFITIIMVGTTSCGNTQKPGSALSGVDSTKSDTIKSGIDAQFLIKVAGINLEEIKLGQLAQQKGTLEDVKNLGKMMEDDHTKAQSDLTALALKKSIIIPTAIDSNAQNDYQKLMNLSGNDFNKEYCDMMVNGHKGAINLFEKEVTNANDSDIKQMATATLPTLHKHLEHATMCQKECEKMQ